jgi:hypothetical protein
MDVSIQGREALLRLFHGDAGPQPGQNLYAALKRIECSAGSSRFSL